MGQGPPVVSAGTSLMGDVVSGSGGGSGGTPGNPSQGAAAALARRSASSAHGSIARRSLAREASEPAAAGLTSNGGSGGPGGDRLYRGGLVKSSSKNFRQSSEGFGQTSYVSGMTSATRTSGASNVVNSPFGGPSLPAIAASPDTSAQGLPRLDMDMDVEAGVGTLMPTAAGAASRGSPGPTAAPSPFAAGHKVRYHDHALLDQ